MKPCRDRQHEVSEDAGACPQCGAPEPAKANWNGYGWEYKSKAILWGLPLLHISFKYRDRRAVPAKGIFAIGQFACGVVTLCQFGIGLISVGQFTIAGFAVAQFGIAGSLVAQIGIYVSEGWGQTVIGLGALLKLI